MVDKLTAKQEGFVQDVFKGETLAQSYRNNYNTKSTTEKSIWELASHLMANVKVTSRLIELQETVAERSMVTVMSITQELEEARIVSMTEGQGSGMTAASMGKAKVNGLLVDRSEVELKGKLDTKWTVEVIRPKKDNK